MSSFGAGEGGDGLSIGFGGEAVCLGGGDDVVEEGKVSLDDSITKYFPDAPESWEPILVKNLLSHASGLSEYGRPIAQRPQVFHLRMD